MQWFNIVVVILCVASATSSSSLCKTNSTKSLTQKFDEITFRLWTRENQGCYIELYADSVNETKELRANSTFKILIHGYLGSADLEPFVAMKTEYLKKDDVNVIIVDWSGIAQTLPYHEPVSKAVAVGDQIGSLVVELGRTLGVPYSNVHLVGHSLGAHVAGFTGKYVSDNGNGSKVARITGLDPAGPLFIFAADADKLAAGDADFVDSIHTDRWKYGGELASSADVHFYPNFGSAPQPGCFMNIISAVCSHSKARDYFTESINSNGFIASECSDGSAYLRGACAENKRAVMGENVDLSVRGTYYLTTNEDFPFARFGKI